MKRAFVLRECRIVFGKNLSMCLWKYDKQS